MPQPDFGKIPARFRKGASILVVEDNPDQWQVIKNVLQTTMEEIKPVWVSTPQQALAYLEDCQVMGLHFPFLILLDLYLPQRENGWQLLNQIRAMPDPVNHLPIIMLSSSDLKEDITQSYDQSITSYLVKPLLFSDWVETFQTFREYWLETVSMPNQRYY